MTTSLLSRMTAGVHRGLIALTLGAATINCAGCTLPGNLSLTGAASVNSASTGAPAAPTAAAGSTQQSGAIQTVSAVEVVPVKDPHAKEPLAKFPAAAPLGKPAELYTYWDKELQFAPDPFHNGERVPCVVGRLIMLDGQVKEKAVCCDGKLRVTLYDDEPAGGGPAVKLEQWDINPNNLRKMVCKDQLHMWGYTLALPTATCEHRSTKIHLDVAFTPDGGDTQYSTSGIFKLKSIASTYHQGTVPTANNHPAQAAQAAGLPQEPQPMPQMQSQPMRN
jgi:hypothetical protein